MKVVVKTHCTDDSGFSQALNAAKDSDSVIMVMGLDDHLEGESHDRMPESQLQRRYSCCISTTWLPGNASG